MPLATIVLLAVAGVVGLWSVTRTTGPDRPQVTNRPLMTPMERRTIAYIEQAVPGARVHAQVSMGALIKPRSGLSAKDRGRVFFSFAAKRIDYVLEDRRSGEIMALVELDDRTHDSAADQKRDCLTKAAGYLTIRIPATERPTRETVADRLNAALMRDPRSEVSKVG
jgi:hypothetical protein